MGSWKFQALCQHFSDHLDVYGFERNTTTVIYERSASGNVPTHAEDQVSLSGGYRKFPIENVARSPQTD